MRILLLALLLALLPSTGQAESCPRAQRPQVDVSTRQDSPRLDNSVGISGLQAMSASRDSAASSANHFVLGLASAQVTFQLGIRAQISQQRDGSLCASLSSVDVEYAFANTAIHVANEIPQGTCIYQEILAHEQRHVSVDGQLLREWQYRLQQDTQYAAYNVGTVQGTDQQALMQELQNRLRDKLQQTTDALLGERARRQAQVDTRMEYDRVSRVCHGAAQDIIRKTMGY